jgi:hypothetical protein
VLTCVDGTQNYYEVLAWTTESRADANRAVLHQVSESFQEGTATSTTRLIYDPHANANDAIAQALTQAKADQKRVLLDFGADWCPDCLVLAQLLDDPQVKPFLDDHYHVVRIDVGRWDNNLDVANRYGDPIAKGVVAKCRMILGAQGSRLLGIGTGKMPALPGSRSFATRPLPPTRCRHAPILERGTAEWWKRRSGTEEGADRRRIAFRSFHLLRCFLVQSSDAARHV